MKFKKNVTGKVVRFSIMLADLFFGDIKPQNVLAKEEDVKKVKDAVETISYFLHDLVKEMEHNEARRLDREKAYEI